MNLLSLGYLNFLIEKLEAAERYFFLASYLASPPLPGLGKRFASAWMAIYRAVERGVDFRLLVDSGAESALVARSYQRLSSYPFPCSLKIMALSAKQKLHAKLWVCDDTFCYVGSHNFTKRSFQSPYEIGLAGRDPGLALSIKQLFLSFWSVSFVV